MMKVSYYNENLPYFDGCACHGIKGYWKGKASAYFDHNKNMVDAEHVTDHSTRPVRRDSPMWKEIDRKCQIWLRDVHTDNS